MKMTICELRKKYMHHDFYFFKGKREMQKAPFFHQEIKSFEVVDDDTIFIFI